MDKESETATNTSALMPVLEITYSSSPSELYSNIMIMLTIVIPTLSIILPAMLWMVKKLSNEKTT